MLCDSFLQRSFTHLVFLPTLSLSPSLLLPPWAQHHAEFLDFGIAGHQSHNSQATVVVDTELSDPSREISTISNLHTLDHKRCDKFDASEERNPINCRESKETHRSGWSVFGLGVLALSASQTKGSLPASSDSVDWELDAKDDAL